MEAKGDIGADWQGQLEALQAIRAERPLTAEELDRLGHVAYAAGAFESAVSAWEELHARHIEEGDSVGAARAAASVALHLMMDTGLMAPVRGWATRAERLLADQGELDVHAWLAVVRTYERVMCGDVEQAARWADRAIDLGTRLGVPAAAAIGRLAAARVVILEGRPDDGLRLLDDVAVATVSGELDPQSVGIVYCELICAMQGLAQYDRAEEWTEAMAQWRPDAFGAMGGRCRVHRAEILRMRGSCLEAEEEALRACDELRPWMRREFGWPLTELGTIRLRRGDLDGAEAAFVAAHESGWEPQPGLALLHLARGDVATASALIGDALRRPFDVPSKERPPYGGLRRAPLLDAQVQIAVADGDLEGARQAAAELSEVATTFRSRALVAAAALARGRVALADDDPRAAVAACEEAVGCWSDVGAPYETATARMVLAAAHLALDDDGCADLELRAARATLERIGAVAVPAGATSPRAGRMPPKPAARAADRPVFRLEGDTRTVVYDGTTVLLRDLKGMRYLARLLVTPGRELHVLDLVAADQGTAGAPGGRHVASDAGPVLDDEARAAYRRRLRDIEEDIDEATAAGDGRRLALAEADRDYLVRELARAYGLGGRERRALSDSERARASVTRALRYAVDRIARHHAALGEHLDRTLSTGTYCCYAPDPRSPITWET